jgi:translocation protein SEC66
MADVQRVLRIREDKPALQNLLQKGSIGDDLWNSLLSAEKELEAEIVEVVSEANSFVEGWGQVIFPTANEMLANEKMRAVFERTAETRAELGIKSHMLFQLLPIDNVSRSKI